MGSWLTQVTATRPALLFMVWTLPLPCCLPWPPSCLPLWRPHLLPEINTITSRLGRSTVKEKIPFIQILGVFCWYAGQRVLNKTELNLWFQRNRHNSVFQYRVVRLTIPQAQRHPKQDCILPEVKLVQPWGENRQGSIVCTLWEVALMAGFLIEYLQSDYSPRGWAVSPEVLLG